MQTNSKYVYMKYNSSFEVETNYYNTTYEIISRKGPSRMLIVAPHGGRIEPGTTEIADSIAGQTHSFYSLYTFFSTRKKDSDEDIYHTTSCYFDEPKLSRMIRESFGVITIHGCRETREVVFIGGKNFRLKNIIKSVLANDNILVDEKDDFLALDEDNICNRSISGEGIQLELSKALRQSLFENNIFVSNDLDRTARFPDLIPNDRFSVLVRGIRKAIKIFLNRSF